MPDYTKNGKLKLGYDKDMWDCYGLKVPVSIDVSHTTNSHILLCGLSGGGKSFMEQSVFAKLYSMDKTGEYWFADYKQEDSFSYLRGCKRYKPYKNTLEALDAVYTRLNDRLSGKDTSRNPVTLIWDEYVANVLALINQDKKTASEVMNKVAEILLLGRSMGVRLACSCQRPDAIVFPAGSRLNYGLIVVLGAEIRSIYEMLLPDFMQQVQGRRFKRGEGIALLQGSDLRCIKIPVPRDVERMKALCIQALSKD